MKDEEIDSIRRTALKKVGTVSGTVIGIPLLSNTTAADQDIGTERYTCPQGLCGGENNLSASRGWNTVERSANSEFPTGSGTSYTNAASQFRQLSNGLQWDEGAGKYSVHMSATAYAATGYELDDGTTGTEDLFRSWSEINVDTEHSNEVSTVAHDDTDWGVSVLGRSDNNDPPSEADAVAEAAILLYSSFGEGMSSLYTAMQIYSNYKESTINSDLNREWHAHNYGQSVLGHYIEYSHKFPPANELGSDTIDVSVTHTLNNALYKPATDWTGDREPTDQYSKTLDYTIYVPETGGED
ncbi:hypothetical protein [Natrinema salaciae]|uniref:Uncharacterized protein n=1 Tax=Natrinema salaciae TaxID=1186196 RepID=A0A1H9J0P4_9EURY|nr:hypothetical protein [Natrinema salaciae]SEQ80621.1 hypothetical protein SAMN04489841_2407 [Natrinema salaciae]